jgi:hypothetical protein
LYRSVAQLTKSISDKHEEVMARMGSIMAAGILDAGALMEHCAACLPGS